jgi:hypothetical protein
VCRWVQHSISMFKDRRWEGFICKAHMLKNLKMWPHLFFCACSGSPLIDRALMFEFWECILVWFSSASYFGSGISVKKGSVCSSLYQAVQRTYDPSILACQDLGPRLWSWLVPVLPKNFGTPQLVESQPNRLRKLGTTQRTHMHHASF